MLSFVQIDMQAIESHKMLTGNMSAMVFLSVIPKLDIERIIQTSKISTKKMQLLSESGRNNSMGVEF